MRILIVEDHADLARSLDRQFTRIGMLADVATNLHIARELADKKRYAFAILDRRLPDGDGLSFIPPLRQAQPGIRIIMLTALDALNDKIAGLDAGADDYLTKPFEPDELMARIRACARRPGGEALPVMTLENLAFDPTSRDVQVAGRPLVLRSRELALLESLMQRAGRVVSRDTLMDEVYGSTDAVHWNRLNVHISQLRQHLKASGAEVEIQAARNIGYLIMRREP